ncbi:hypothetical protein D8M04_09610 [Oceanobacillus piezotolerans]|uniref:Uncharacterized protein n=1 Tax=Oceanobacillus piezotolerans TaxID=2448030 RepID=A0A498DDR2_9BACI|nr:hypothetical protein [Oceanobacillus piezotolerans]RLL45114.1 hypothetical protein D8M04_09610 [Oceanobacillus piezotolerans]
MALSKAKKQRLKRIREGRLDPEINRSPYAHLDLRTRRTKTKKDNIYRHKHKNRFPKNWENDSFYFYLFQLKMAIKKIRPSWMI